MKNDGVKYMTVDEGNAVALTFDDWYWAMDYIDYILNKTETHSIILFELVDGKIVNGMRYMKGGQSEVVL